MAGEQTRVDLPATAVSMLELLQNQDGGRLIQRMYLGFSQVGAEVIAINDVKRSGKVTMEFTLSLLDEGDVALVIADNVKLTLPKKKGGAKVYYLGSEDGMLHKQDPRQPSLPFRVVENDSSDVRTVNPSRDAREVN